jgi:hypothetical protein
MLRLLRFRRAFERRASLPSDAHPYGQNPILPQNTTHFFRYGFGPLAKLFFRAKRCRCFVVGGDFRYQPRPASRA